MAWKTHRSLVIVSATRSSQRILWPGAGISFKAQTSPHEEKFSAIQQLLFTTYLSETGTWNLKLYLSFRVWIWYFHKNNGFALNKGTFSFPFPFPPPPCELCVVCCVFLCIHGLFLVFVCIRVGAHMCACVHVGEDPRSAWRIPLQHSSTFSQSNPESLASWLWWSLSALSGAEIVGGQPHPPGIYRGFWGFELWSLCLHN